MVRSISYIVILCITSAAVDAATDVESLGSCDEQLAHEAHGEVRGAPLDDASSEDPSAPGEQAAHFCHCAVHAPVLPSSIALVDAPAPEPSPSISAHLYASHRAPPPVRPPKLD